MSCAAMCFTCSCTKDDRSLTDGSRAKLLQASEPKRNHPQKLRRSRLSSSYTGVKNLEAVAKVDAVKKKQFPTWTSFSRLGSPADVNAMQSREAVTKIVFSDESLQPELSTSGFENPAKQDKKAYISAQFVSKMKTKQVKGMITGMGKELRRAASTVGEKIPNPTKKKNKAEKERQELLRAEPRKPQVRNPDEIKAAYGHATDTRHMAGMAHDKLHERGEKLSAVQRRTAELESDAANFSSLAEELVKKMESRKWYEL